MKIISGIIGLMKRFFEKMFDTVICYNGDFTQIFPKKGEETPLVLNSKKKVYAKKRKLYVLLYLLMGVVFFFSLWIFMK